MRSPLHGLRFYVHDPGSDYSPSWRCDLYMRDLAHLEEMGAAVASDPREAGLTAIIVHTPMPPIVGYEYLLGDVHEPDGPPTEWPLAPLVKRFRDVPILQRRWIHTCFKRNRALLGEEHWGGWRLIILDGQTCPTPRAYYPLRSQRHDYYRPEGFPPPDSLTATLRRRSPPLDIRSPPPRNYRQRERSRSPDQTRRAPPGSPWATGSSTGQLSTPRSPSEHEPGEITRSPPSSPLPGSRYSPPRVPSPQRVDSHQPQGGAQAFRPRVMKMRACGSRPAPPIPTSSYNPCPPAVPSPNVNNAAKWRPISQAAGYTTATLNLNPETSIQAVLAVPQVADADEAAPLLEGTVLTPQPDIEEISETRAQNEMGSSYSDIDFTTPSPPSSAIDLTPSPETSRPASTIPISTSLPVPSTSGFASFPRPNPPTFPPIFTLGPSQMQFHVLPSVGRLWVEMAITFGGGVLTTLEWAKYVIRLPDTLERDVWDYEAVRRPDAQLMRPQWVFESMAGAKLLKPHVYEVDA